MTNQMPASVRPCSVEMRLADAWSTAVPGSHSLWATCTATTGTANRAVRVAKAARSLRSLSWAVSCSIWPRTAVSWAWISRTSLIFVARAAMPWKAVSLDWRFRIRASRSTTCEVTSAAWVCSETILVVSPPRVRRSARASSHRSAGMRYEISAYGVSPSVPALLAPT